MEVVCPKGNLIEAINIVHKAVSSRTTLAILEGIYIEAVNGKIKLYATDLEIGIETYIEGQILREGNMVVSAKIFAEIIRKLPDADVQVRVDESRKIYINCKNSSFTLSGYDPKEYPEAPFIDKEHSYLIAKDLFKNMIRQTSFAAAANETMPILTGVLLEISNDDAYMVALDGYKLALRKAKFGELQNNTKIVIPSKTLNEIGRIITSDEGDVEILLSNNQVIFKIDETMIYSRTLEGEFINFRQIIPKDYKLKVTANTKELVSSIDRASLLAREGKSNLVKLNFSNDKLTITSNAEIGSVNEELPILMEGDSITIAFNARYLMDGLKSFDSEEVYLELTSSLSPCIIKPCDNENHLYLVLPVRLN